MKATALRKTNSSTLFNIELATGAARLVQWCKTALRFAIPQNGDLLHLNPHLRRDAGIDELEIERMKAISAPLIRSKA